MSADARPAAAPLRRVLLALGASVPGASAARAAARLAADIRAEIRALFVEETALLRLAELPFAREIDLGSGAERPLERDSVRRALETLAGQARKLVAAAADRTGVRWSFDVVRGDPGGSVAAAARDRGGVDLVLIHRASSARARTIDLGADILDSGALFVPPLLVVERELPRVERALVAASDTADIPSLFAAATDLLGAAAVDLLVLAEDERSAERIEREARRAVAPGLFRGVAARIAAATAERLAAIVRTTGCDALVVRLREIRRENASPSLVAARVNRPLLLVP